MTSLSGKFHYENKSVSDQVCDTIRKLIINRVIPKGERLVETSIAKELAVSITPVRHAFAQLSNEGLITVLPFKGSYVTEISPRYVKDVIQTRLILEPGAVQLCFNALNSRDADKLKQHTAKSDEYCVQGSIFEATEEDLAFHDYFFKKSNNDLLEQMWKSLRTRIQYIQSYTKPQILPPTYLQQRHAGMIAALEKKNLSSFIENLVHHIETSFDFSYFEEDVSELA